MGVLVIIEVDHVQTVIFNCNLRSVYISTLIRAAPVSLGPSRTAAFSLDRLLLVTRNQSDSYWQDTEWDYKMTTTDV